jgi:hypothetical protein
MTEFGDSQIRWRYMKVIEFGGSQSTKHWLPISQTDAGTSNMTQGSTAMKATSSINSGIDGHLQKRKESWPINRTEAEMQIDSREWESRNTESKNEVKISGEWKVTKARLAALQVHVCQKDEYEEKKRIDELIIKFTREEPIIWNHLFSGSTSASIISLFENEPSRTIESRGRMEKRTYLDNRGKLSIRVSWNEAKAPDRRRSAYQHTWVMKGNEWILMNDRKRRPQIRIQKSEYRPLADGARNNDGNRSQNIDWPRCNTSVQRPWTRIGRICAGDSKKTFVLAEPMFKKWWNWTIPIKYHSNFPPWINFASERPFWGPSPSVQREMPPVLMRGDLSRSRAGKSSLHSDGFATARWFHDTVPPIAIKRSWPVLASRSGFDAKVILHT